MKNVLLTLVLLSSVAALKADYLPEDQRQQAQMEAELKQKEQQVEKLHGEIATLREKKARHGSAATVRQAQTHKRSLAADRKRARTAYTY